MWVPASSARSRGMDGGYEGASAGERVRTSRRSSSQAPEGTDIWLLTPAPCEYCIARAVLTAPSRLPFQSTAKFVSTRHYANQTPPFAVVSELRFDLGCSVHPKPDFTFKTTVNFESSCVINLHFVYQITYQSQNDS